MTHPSAHDFFDFGCSQGGSIAHAMKHFNGLRGLGIDIDPRKVEATRARGFDAEVLDILKLPEKRQVRFVTMMHFLEHLDSYATACAMLRKACAVSREFVYVAQPFFDADGLLARDGLKLYWSDWRGHSFCMSTLQLYRALEALRAQGLVLGFKIAWNARITGSSDRAVLPLSALRDQHDYEPSQHGTKPSGRFSYPVYRELRAIIDTGNANRRLLEAQARLDEVVIDSGWLEKPSVTSIASGRVRATLARILGR